MRFIMPRVSMTEAATNAPLNYLKNWRVRKMPSSDFFEGYKNNLINRLYGLLCEREKNGEWRKFCDSLFIELLGFNSESICYWRLRGNLGALSKLDYPEFRKTIFECIRLVNGLTENDIH